MCINDPVSDNFNIGNVNLAIPAASISIVKDNGKRLESQIQDILEAINASEQFVADMDFTKFSQDQKSIFAIERAIGIIGSSVKRLPINLRDKYNEIAWREIIGTAEKLTYSFFEVDIAVLWRLTQHEVPQLKTFILQLLEELVTEPNNIAV